MHVFSSTVDPSWTLLPPQIEILRDSFPLVECSDSLRYPILGYQGFTLNGNRIRGCPRLESFLLSTCSISIKPQVTAYVASQLDLIISASSKMHMSLASIQSFLSPLPLQPSAVPVDPALPIRGPDTVPVYDPNNDLQGHFVSHQTENNCYNYANDVATDTFAQPGRGSGKKWSFDTCADINASAVRDGLQWIGTEMPSAPPAVGHHVVRTRGGVLVILTRTNRDFGFGQIPTSTGAVTTQTSFGRTSPGRPPSRTLITTAKPSRTPPRCTSDSCVVLVGDIPQADVAPWTEFCGYFATVPSKVDIN